MLVSYGDYAFLLFRLGKLAGGMNISTNELVGGPELFHHACDCRVLCSMYYYAICAI